MAPATASDAAREAGVPLATCPLSPCTSSIASDHLRTDALRRTRVRGTAIRVAHDARCYRSSRTLVSV